MKFDGWSVHRDNDKYSRSAQDVMNANTTLHLGQMKKISMGFEQALHYHLLGNVRRAIVLRLHQEKSLNPNLQINQFHRHIHTHKIVL